jgi:heat shock protein HslJ
MNKTIVLLIPVLLAGVLAVSCTGGASPRETSIDFNEIRDREWRLTAFIAPSGSIDLSRQKLETDGMGDFYTLRFDGDRLGGKGAPNRYSAPYTLGNGQTLSIGPAAATLMAAFREPELKEHDYFAYLGKVSRWNYEEGKLELYISLGESGEGVLVFHEGTPQ